MSKKNEFGALDLISVYDEKKENPDKIPISEIISNPNQPRVFGKDNVDDLLDSIERLGLIEPIVVRKDLDGYVLVAGERRLNAATKLGWSEIPAIVTDANPDVCYEMALAENEKRKSLNPWEVGRAIDYLRKEKNKTADEVGKILGYTPRYIKQLNAIARIEQDVVNEFIQKGNEPSIKNLERLLKMQSGEEQPKYKYVPKNNRIVIDLKRIPEQARVDFMEELQNLKIKYGI
ncbi:MAG: ParB/RepB/Spo0J family partition protein [Leptospiraceae bacterium]|nr:ParB/RepB/Spo0J family partition protein [Leptospiraceae bacterium]MCP5496759.1 ParB/RepB/Spo0J family partition protein [Leptospiraceae bacterium]